MQGAGYFLPALLITPKSAQVYENEWDSTSTTANFRAVTVSLTRTTELYRTRAGLFIDTWRWSCQLCKTSNIGRLSSVQRQIYFCYLTLVLRRSRVPIARHFSPDTDLLKRHLCPPDVIKCARMVHEEREGP